jgi:hypothetical protein
MTDYGIIVALLLVVVGAMACFCWMLYGDPEWARFTPSVPTTPSPAVDVTTPRTPPVAITATMPRTPLDAIPVDTVNTPTVPYQAIRLEDSWNGQSECDVPVVVVVVEQADQAP